MQKLTALLALLCTIILAPAGWTATARASSINPGAAGFPVVNRADQLQFGAMAVDLFGIRAPQPGTVCRAEGISFHCGDAAVQAVRRIVQDYAVSCEKVSNSQLFPMLTECHIGQSDLNRLILRAGWAMVDMNVCDNYPRCKTYIADQNFARDNRKGMWLGTPPESLVVATRKSDTKTAPGTNAAARDAIFKIDLAAEMKARNAPDRTLISFLMP
ncbi:thermonuclease family protein [Thalassospira sp. TSL5-1]|uniref:thermonuclease family protein n=1 Tax=Thalassospira sp. TSL5-1 TaxID=1544451 RepID=UPI00093D820B|nr:thermonuclease family protein [Thalassospira sp. TSL5-1]OKH88442.1 nuclease [Thalassospira sp. TSL5-1]